MAKNLSKIENKTQPANMAATEPADFHQPQVQHIYGYVFFEDLTFRRPDVLKTWRFDDLTFCKPDVLYTWRFVNLTFQTFWNRTFWNLTFCGCTIKEDKSIRVVFSFDGQPLWPFLNSAQDYLSWLMNGTMISSSFVVLQQRLLIVVFFQRNMRGFLLKFCTWSLQHL